MTRLRATLCLVACLLLGGAACGSSTTKAPPTQAPVDLRGRAQVDVDAKSNRFTPATVVVDPGTTVTWHNRDAITHNIHTAPGAADFGGAFGAESGAFGPGKTYSFRFEKIGNFDYTCTIHPGMTGTVQVAP